MLIDIALLAYCIIVFGGFTVYIVRKFGVLKSFSDSFYKLKHRIVFKLVLWSVAFPMMIVGHTLLMYIAGGLIAVVGLAAAFKQNKFIEIVHIIGAIGGIAVGFVAVWVDYHYWYLTIIMLCFSLFMYFYKVKNYTWWIEMLAFTMVFFALVLKTLKKKKSAPIELSYYPEEIRNIIKRFIAYCESSNYKHLAWRKSVVEGQFNRNTFDTFDEKSMIRITFCNNRYQIESYSTWETSKTSSIVVHEITEQLYLQLKEIFFSGFKEDVSYLTKLGAYGSKNN